MLWYLYNLNYDILGDRLCAEVPGQLVVVLLHLWTSGNVGAAPLLHRFSVCRPGCPKRRPVLHAGRTGGHSANQNFTLLNSVRLQSTFRYLIKTIMSD